MRVFITLSPPRASYVGAQWIKEKKEVKGTRKTNYFHLSPNYNDLWVTTQWYQICLLLVSQLKGWDISDVTWMKFALISDNFMPMTFFSTSNKRQQLHSSIKLVHHISLRILSVLPCQHIEHNNLIRMKKTYFRRIFSWKFDNLIICHSDWFSLWSWRKHLPSLSLICPSQWYSLPVLFQVLHASVLPLTYICALWVI